MTAFCGLGEWKGTAEVYGGDGRFVGNGADQRHIRTPLEGDRIRIDLSFVGPFKMAGHYVIHDKGSHRVYEGPANIGLAEAVAENLVDADHYWPGIGLGQRFFLMVLPGGTKQVSLALLSRGERLAYAVVGENEKVAACEVGEGKGSETPPGFVQGASIDLANDPNGGRDTILLHRPGRWRGRLAYTDGVLKAIGTADYEERVEAKGSRLDVRVTGGGIAPEPCHVDLATDGWQAWSAAGAMVGSYGLYGGRALAGTFHRSREELRVWRREVVIEGGARKAVVHVWYRGGTRIGVQHGVLGFEAG